MCWVSLQFMRVLAEWFKFQTRGLYPEEIEAAKMVFGKALPLDQVRIDEGAFLGPKQRHFAYVSFHTVNFWGNMPMDLLIHELVHVWQYRELGAVYIPWALLAQRSPMRYNYGGVANLKDLLKRGEGLRDLNLEQQADVAADYFRLLHGRRPQWGTGGVQDIPIYERLLREAGLGN